MAKQKIDKEQKREMQEFVYVCKQALKGPAIDQSFAKEAIEMHKKLEAKYGKGSVYDFMDKETGLNAKFYFDNLGLDNTKKEKVQESEKKNEKSAKTKESAEQQVWEEKLRDFEYACYHVAYAVSQGDGAEPYFVKMATDLYRELEFKNGNGSTYDFMINESKKAFNMEKETGLRVEDCFGIIGLDYFGKAREKQKKPEQQYKGESLTEINLESAKPVEVIESTPASPTLIQQLQSKAAKTGVSIYGLAKNSALHLTQGVMNQFKKLEEMLRISHGKGR